jgi:ubiquinone/menaquinone biosynthesis C-methylase UbiE
MMSIQFRSKDDYILWNEEMSRKYDSEDYHLRANFLIRWIERRRVKIVLEFLNAGPADAVVEIGCGAGVVLEQVPAGRLLGLDLSGFILKKTRDRLKHLHAGLIQANAERLPFASKQFRKLLCTEVIEHVPDPRRVVREMARVTSEAGVIVITVPNEGWIARVKRGIQVLGLTRWLLLGTDDANAYDSPGEANEWHLHQFDLELLRQVTAEILIINELHAIPFRFLPLRYVACCQVLPTHS